MGTFSQTFGNTFVQQLTKVNQDPLSNYYVVTLESGVKISTLESPNELIYVLENPFLTSNGNFVKTEQNKLITVLNF